MRVHFLCAGAGFACVVLAAAADVIVSPGLAAEPTEIVAENDGLAGDLVQAALECEIAGDSERRDELLKQALQQAPDYPPARWHSGYVRVDDQWLSLEEAEQRASADGRFTEYRRLRDAYAGTPMGALAVARWCQKSQLEAEAGFHWRKVLELQPHHEEALKNVRSQHHQRKSQTDAQIDETNESQTQAEENRRKEHREEQRWQRHFAAMVTKWRQAIEQGDSDFAQSMQEELDAMEDWRAMQVLDSIIHNRCRRTRAEKEREAYRTLSLKLIEILDAMGKTSWLVENAVEHPFPEVRTAAADALGKRPTQSYVRSLVQRIRAPVEASFSIVTYPDGGVNYQHSFYREGVEADSLEIHSHATYLAGEPIKPLYVPIGADVPESRLQAWSLAKLAAAPFVVARKSLRERARAAAKAVETQRRVEKRNAPIIERNRRIEYALARATGVYRSAKDWQEWLNDSRYDYYELERPYKRYGEQRPYDPYGSNKRREKPLNVKRSYQTHYDYAVPFRPPSCFSRGTKVWTVTGPMPIEDLKAGDRVLSQDPRSGELAYKLVLETTTRDPTPMIKINLGSETIRATRGHPFWVAGEGWRMAKELEAGSRLRGVRGAVLIASLDETPPAMPWYEFSHNLVVEDFHTYFAGDNRILVHDNTSFRGTSPPVPSVPKPQWQP